MGEWLPTERLGLRSTRRGHKDYWSWPLSKRDRAGKTSNVPKATGTHTFSRSFGPGHSFEEHACCHTQHKTCGRSHCKEASGLRGPHRSPSDAGEENEMGKGHGKDLSTPDGTKGHCRPPR